jgi:CRISPR-associated protein Cmr6
MEQGELIIIKTRRGYSGKIKFEKKDGKFAELPISVVTFIDNKLHGKECSFKRNRGILEALKVGDDIIYPIQTSSKPSVKDKPKRFSKNKTTRGNSNPISDSLDISTTFLCKDVQDLALDIKRLDIDNFALKLNKGARYDHKMERFQFFKRERKGENYAIKPFCGDFNFKELAERQKKSSLASFDADGLSTIEMDLNWRMALGLGNENVYETAITLHHTYGIPYIPASSLKGVVRSWIIIQVFGQNEKGTDDWKNAEKKALKNENFCKIFGSDDTGYNDKAQQGKVIFLDAYPINPPQIETDVMNPHYAPYYMDNNNKTPPADYHNPVPIFFLTISQTKFQFVIGSKDATWKNWKIDDKDIEYWLKSALENHGIGAKTAVGYGYMSE